MARIRLSTSTTTKQIFSNVIIVDNICVHSSPVQMIRLSWTCRDALECVRGYFRRAYNINAHLARWFPDPLAFRLMQARTTTLISGSNAIQFFDRTFYPDDALDLFVPLNKVYEVGTWLAGVGYTFMPRQGQTVGFDGVHDQKEWQKQLSDDSHSNDYWGLGARNRILVHVFTFHKANLEDVPPFKIQIMAARVPPIGVVLSFHSTCVMNVISYSTAYSLYPNATFESRVALISSSFDKWDTPYYPYQKYVERACRMVFATGPRQFQVYEAPFDTYSRWIDDHQSWVIQLPTDGVVPPSGRSLHPDPVALTNWRLRSRAPWMSSTLVSDPCLRHVYVLECSFKGGLAEAITRALNRIKSMISKSNSHIHKPSSKSSLPIQLTEKEYRRTHAILRAVCELYRNSRGPVLRFQEDALLDRMCWPLHWRRRRVEAYYDHVAFGVTSRGPRAEGRTSTSRPGRS
ncbi:hypothetical protein BV25DRAFT_785025 [Artomyces pyxidatus]|uniref:Uncharacterized protein n=1 Tax=Artomyces pyxidatus TaxID=48021 RepID=A0ACB8SZN6_9AGAM|nr:hypothetical protein BV25DRAFT_785025 [Artomyces pyxidatus]